jgi:hypothetical protein
MADAPSLPGNTVAAARLRVGEALLAHARSLGIPDLPADRLAQMTDAGAKLLEGLSPSELQNLSPASGAVMNAAMTSFNQVYGQLSETQLRALKSGIDPANLAAVQAFAAGGFIGGVLAGGGASGAAALLGGRANYRAALDGIDGVSLQKMASYSAAYGDVGLGTGTIALFAKVDLDRSSYDAFTKEGYSRGAIKEAASDTNALGWKGADAVADAIHAPDALRNAAIAAVNAETDAGRAACERRMEAVYDGLAPDQKAKAAPFIRRLNATHQIDAANAPELSRVASDADLISNPAVAADPKALKSTRAAMDAVAARATGGDASDFVAALDLSDSAALPAAATRPVRKPGAGPAPAN